MEHNIAPKIARMETSSNELMDILVIDDVTLVAVVMLVLLVFGLRPVVKI